MIATKPKRPKRDSKVLAGFNIILIYKGGKEKKYEAGSFTICKGKIRILKGKRNGKEITISNTEEAEEVKLKDLQKVTFQLLGDEGQVILKLN